MRHNYADILSRIDEKPQWFDEEGVPRYDKFEPQACANIYATEAVLLLIHCQSCQHPFMVCISRSSAQSCELFGSLPLAKRVADNSIHYFDPPNIGCCLAGPTMNSVPQCVIEFWSRDGSRYWQRDEELEVPISCDWAGDDQEAP